MAGERLRVIEGPHRGKLLSVDVSLLIGRSAPDLDGRLGGDPKLSRRHAQLSRGADGELRVEDLGSTNGTLLNDERVSAPRKLQVGDRITLGSTVLAVVDGAGGRPEPPVAGPPSPVFAPAEELAIIAGPAPQRRLTVRDELVIGRAGDGDGRLTEDPELSRRHARLARDADGRLTVEDLDSANGTFVNGERVRGCRVLRVGDALRVGTTTMQVKAVDPTAPPPPRSPLPRAAPSTTSPPPPGAGLPLGSVFAGCRVEEMIGHGDMGIVYRAEELALARPVALKLIRPEHSSDDRFRDRFRRESQVVASIDHQNVIPLFDAGDEDGLLYITMRLVQGTDLRALIAAEGRVDPVRAARIVSAVGAALDAAHGRGIVHRDVKPSNVLLAAGDHVYLSDFGLARATTSVGDLTRPGSIVARVEYVAPEQLLNRSVDARVDVYALGCVLFEALTGEPPFARWGEGPHALAHLDAAPPSAVERAPDLPREFDTVIRRAMAKDPAERYPSAGELGQAALLAARANRRPRRWSAVTDGQSALALSPSPAQARERSSDERSSVAVSDAGGGIRFDLTRWSVALAVLVIVAIGMVAALRAISTL